MRHNPSQTWLFTSGDGKRAYKATEVRTDSDGDWLSPRAAARYTGQHRDTLRKWRLNGTPLLGGRKLESRMFSDGLGRKTRFLSKALLDKAIATRAQGVPGAESGQWVPIQEAAATYRWSVGALKNWCKRACPYLSRPIRSAREFCNGRTGRPVLKRILWKPDLEEIKTARNAGAVPADKITLADVAKECGVSPQTVHRWRREGLAGKPRKKLAGAKGTIGLADRKRRGWLFALGDVDELKALRAAGEEQVYHDEVGDWLSESLALDRFPNARPWSLAPYRNQSCPQLGGEILRAQEIRSRTGPRGTRWVYLLEDLKRLAPPKRGKPIAAPEQPLNDAEGRWLPLAQACELAGLTPGRLYYLREEKTVRAKKVRSATHNRSRHKKVWVYHEGDLQAVAAKRGHVVRGRPEIHARVSDPPQTALPPAPSPAAPAANAAQRPFIPTAFQQRILEALKEKVLTADSLQSKLNVDRKRLFRDGLNKLKEQGKIINDRAAGGYYRPDSPPPKYAEFLGGN
jgi:hypothetical protein